MKILQRLLNWNLLFLAGFLLCILLDTTGSPLQVKAGDVEKTPVSDLSSQQIREFNLKSDISNVQFSVSQLVERGEQLYEAGKYTEAITLWQQALAGISTAQERAGVRRNLAAAFRQIGQIEPAIDQWEQAIKIYRQAGSSTARIELGRSIAEQGQAYSELGQHKRAINLLQSALQIAQHNQDKLAEAAAMGGLANTYFALGDYEKALSFQENSLKIARELDRGSRIEGENYKISQSRVPNYIQTALNNLGNVYAKRADRYRYQANVAELEGDEREKTRLLDLAQQDIAAAKAAFEQSIQLKTTDAVTVQGLLNLNRLLQRNAKVFNPQVTPSVNSDIITSNRAQALALLEKMPESRDKAYSLINLAVDADSAKAAKLLANAIAVTRNIGDTRAESFGLGSLAQVYEKANQYKEALDLNRQAQFAAQKVNAVDSLYRWQWQAGRILRATGETDKAILYYEQAIASLQSIRSDILAANKDLQFDFRDSVEPVYRQMMGLLLQPTNNREIYTKNLSKVLNTLELLKLAELQNFFGDECVQVAKDNAAADGNIADTGAAVIYSIILDDRTEMIMRSPNGQLKGYPVAMGQDILQQEIDKLRLLLESRATEEYLPQSQKIYDLLIRPIEKDLELAKPKTLVFINDGVLRKVPMAALHDGQKFLIQKYAIATTPSLSLTASKAVERGELKVLSVGLTVERPPFAALLNVAAEVNEVQKILGGTKLLDKDFTIARLETELRQNNFPIIHIATHGKFGADAASTFLVGFDDRISIDQIDNLLRFTGRNRARITNKKTVELLTLSACQTAAGDNRSALGIAGVAVRAGVKSALASLWFINDEATVPLIEEFYTQLRQPNITKAEALQKAQLKLIASDDYNHPSVWSPFILIGNWL
ncbi:CHAT domain-containing protein [Argonema antarcticum]|uniref:CHAT domain-containing protein n=1 Tax=Argonema antarcticum TaxID=2942763 RepID=UPI002010CAFA|nr:CHAT domain-containing protein [Argonema antarcticum]MCL1471852.1 CHAT domain-containing protein [Argonema antarcticum A004/B2]